MHRRAGTSHRAVYNTKKQRRNLRGTGLVSPQETKKITTLLAGNSY
jgi:ribosomal protein L35